MTAQELVNALIARNATTLRMAASALPSDPGDPFDNGMAYVISQAVGLAYGFNRTETAQFIRMTVGGEC